jgi:hypothetical protein
MRKKNLLKYRLPLKEDTYAPSSFYAKEPNGTSVAAFNNYVLNYVL